MLDHLQAFWSTWWSGVSPGMAFWFAMPFVVAAVGCLAEHRAHRVEPQERPTR